MRNKFITALSFLAIFPCSIIALPINSYFQQGLTVDNHSSQTILVTDHAEPQLSNYRLESGYKLTARYASDQFTIPSGQSFSHTVNINAEESNKLICTVTSHLLIGLNSIQAERPTTSDESKCETSVYLSFNEGSSVYGSRIIVWP